MPKKLWLLIALLLACSASMMGQSNVVNYLYHRNTTDLANGLGWNIGDYPYESVLAQASGATVARATACGWSGYEVQTPGNTSGGFSASLPCTNFINNQASHGLKVRLVAAYGPPAHATMNVSITSAVASNSIVIPVTFASAIIAGQSLSTITTTQSFLSDNTPNTPNPFCTHHGYNGCLIVGVSLIDSTHANLILSSATTTDLNSGDSYQILDALYPPAKGVTTSDAFMLAWKNYTNNLATYCAATAATAAAGAGIVSKGCDIELWNEPSWPSAPDDNGKDYYDQFTGAFTQSGTTLTVLSKTSTSPRNLSVGDGVSGTGLPGYPNLESVTAIGTVDANGIGTYTVSASATVSSATSFGAAPNYPGLEYGRANMGMVAIAQASPVVAGVSYLSGLTGKSGAYGANAPQFSTDTGLTYSGPQPAYETFHPYGNNPDQANWSQSALVLSPTSNTNLISVSTSNSIFAEQKNLQAFNAGGTYIGHNVSETGCGQSGYYLILNYNGCPSLTESMPNFIANQFVTWMAQGGNTDVTVYRLYDTQPNARVGYTAVAAASGGQTVYTGSFAPGAKTPTITTTLGSVNFSVSDATNIYATERVESSAVQPGTTIATFDPSSLTGTLSQNATFTGTSPSSIFVNLVTSPLTAMSTVNAVNSVNNGSFHIVGQTSTSVTLDNAAGVAESSVPGLAYWRNNSGLSSVTLLNSAGNPCVNPTECAASTSAVLLPSYSTLQHIVSTAAQFSFASPTTCTDTTQDTVSSYTGGTYPLNYTHWCGSRTGTSKSWITHLYQMSNVGSATCDSVSGTGCWGRLARPTGATVVMAINPSCSTCRVTSVTDTVTLAPVSFTQIGLNYTIAAVTDHLLEVVVDSQPSIVPFTRQYTGNVFGSGKVSSLVYPLDLQFQEFVGVK